ncbi:MAG: trimethylamine methyltransferase family protein, partial [Clostridia bacterium]|nr:trimethylamine methyltransferase family protein [Clostridia bacterium]
LARGSPLKGTGLFTVAVAVLSPLTLTSGNCDILLESLRYGFPVIPTTCPMAGSTSPYSFSGTLIQGIAESLIVLCAAQVMRPGNPFLFSFGASVTEMSKGRDLYYTVDKALWKMAAAAFAKRLALPAAAEAGGALNCRYDMQSGAEGMLMALSALMSGADVLAGSGSCLNANGVSSEFILSHYAFLDAARHLKTGYSFSDINRSLTSIQEQGCGGNFLMDDLTMERLRDSEFFSSPLFDESGEAGEGTPMLERAHDEARRIDEGFHSPVPADIARALRDRFEQLCAGR